jgi:hypothetical protein
MQRLAPLALGKRAGLRAGTRGPAGRQELERDCGERKNVRGRSPRTPLDALGRRVRTSDRGADADFFERLDNPESRRARFVGGDEDVARVQPAVPDVRGPREIDRPGQLGNERQRLLDGRRRVAAMGSTMEGCRSEACVARLSASASTWACSGTMSSRKTLTATRRSRVGS